LDSDAMSAAPRCHVLCALLLGGLVSATGYAAAIAQPGRQGVQASDSNQKRDAAPREVRQSPVAHDERFVAPQRDVSALRGATGYVAKPAITAARPNLSRRLDLEPGARGFGATSSGAAGRPPSTALSTANRSVARIMPLAAGNGAIGGPRITARGMIGGAVNGKSVLKASIDGNALRRRF
jgi:hypothetical protein